MRAQRMPSDEGRRKERSSSGGAWQAHRAIDTARGSRAPAADPRRPALGRPAPGGLRFVRLGRDAGLRGRRGDRRGSNRRRLRVAAAAPVRLVYEQRLVQQPYLQPHLY